MGEFSDGTYEIIGLAMHVHRELGPGLREKPYEKAQMLNYLRISRKRIGLVINFKNPKLEWQRLVR